MAHNPDIPRKAVDRKRDREPTFGRTPNSLKGATRLRGVLVIDDDAFQRAIFTQYFERQSVEKIWCTEDGLEAKSLLLKHHADIDLIICDINMPEVDGIELLEYLHVHAYECPIVLISGAARPIVNGATRLASAHSINFKGMLTKPIDFERLDALLAAG